MTYCFVFCSNCKKNEGVYDAFHLENLFSIDSILNVSVSITFIIHHSNHWDKADDRNCKLRSSQDVGHEIR